MGYDQDLYFLRRQRRLCEDAMGHFEARMRMVRMAQEIDKDIVLQEDASWTRLSQRFSSWPTERPDVPEDLHGWFDRDNATVLRALLHKLKARQVLELGSWLGRSAKFMLDEVPGMRLVCVDTWDPISLLGKEISDPTHAERAKNSFQIFCRNLWEYRDRLVPHRAKTLDAMGALARCNFSPDLVYVDASHWKDDVYGDVKGAMGNFRGAVICGDDWNGQWGEQVQPAVMQACNEADLRVRHLGKCWYILRRDQDDLVLDWRNGR